MRRADNRREQGLTLLEVLATTVLLGLVATTALRAWSAPSERARIRALVHAVVALDGRARIAARTGAPVVLALDRAGRRLVASSRGDGAKISEVAFSAEDIVELVRAKPGLIKAVLIQSDGTGPDYVVNLKHSEGSTRVTIAGLTGWATIAESPQ